MTDWLRENLTTPLNLPPNAVNWLCDLFDAIQFFDDIYDGDPVSQKATEEAIFNVFVRMPLNPFFAANSSILAPAITTAIIKWQAANHCESNGNASAKSYMWRAGYYDIVLLVLHICHGHEVSGANGRLVMDLYDETLDDYLKEFPCQQF